MSRNVANRKNTKATNRRREKGHVNLTNITKIAKKVKIAKTTRKQVRAKVKKSLEKEGIHKIITNKEIKNRCN